MNTLVAILLSPSAAIQTGVKDGEKITGSLSLSYSFAQTRASSAARGGVDGGNEPDRHRPERGDGAKAERERQKATSEYPGRVGLDPCLVWAF
jgi:hypothetical protein